MTTDTPPPKSNLRWWVCGMLFLATTLNYMDRVALNQTSNVILKEFGLDDRDYARLEAAFDIAFGIGTLLIGWLVDRVNVRWVYPVVVAGWSLAGFLTGYTDTFTMLLLARIALGFFEAGNWPCGIRTTRTILPPAERSFGNALFQSGTAIGAIITPLIVLACFNYYGEDTPGVWTVPFRAIGLIGIVWVVAWIAFVPGRLFPPPLSSTEPATPFSAVFRDRKFWLLVLVIFGVNTGWHTVRVWMPRLLKVGHGYKEEEIQQFGMAYYFAADLGSWGVGLLTMYLAHRGRDLFRVRRGTFYFCTFLLLISTIAVPNLSGQQLQLALIVVGFAALGLFPTYFSLSQEVSGRHQGKVTGTLGCMNAIYMAGMKTAQGAYVNETQRFDNLIAIAAIPAVIACLALLFWPQSNREDAK